MAKYEGSQAPWDFKLLLRFLCGLQGRPILPQFLPAIFPFAEAPKEGAGEAGSGVAVAAAAASLESLHTHTLYFLAQVYTNAGDAAAAARKLVHEE